jgi:hypothetical protein
MVDFGYTRKSDTVLSGVLVSSAICKECSSSLKKDCLTQFSEADTDVRGANEG